MGNSSWSDWVRLAAFTLIYLDVINEESLNNILEQKLEHFVAYFLSFPYISAVTLRHTLARGALVALICFEYDCQLDFQITVLIHSGDGVRSSVFFLCCRLRQTFKCSTPLVMVRLSQPTFNVPLCKTFNVPLCHQAPDLQQFNQTSTRLLRQEIDILQAGPEPPVPTTSYDPPAPVAPDPAAARCLWCS